MSIRQAYVAGVVTEQWDDATRVYTDFRTDPDTTRPYTPQENAVADLSAAAETATVNRATIREQAAAAIQTNRDFLANTSPTNVQVIAQVRALTRQNNGVIRLLLERLDGTD